jgi:hypothetical protein
MAVGSRMNSHANLDGMTDVRRRALRDRHRQRLRPTLGTRRAEDEIAEVIYHSSGYAGFPAANTACKIAREVFDEST